MKKSFSLEDPKHKPARIVESIKAEVRKYLKREHRKALPEDVDFWDFDCRAGKDAETAEVVHVSEIVKPIDTASQEKWDSIYIEILAKPGHRAKPAPKEKPSEEEE
ncbi:MAG: hypothetical protein IZT59_08435 [Verrucomicrobia bacterium]|jgi:hypothetical protein|nr:hypothetical protein [Verrucomicrobiota bacterium]|tara:strand:+ start:10627 stop:10944 length:318 start_codon:yes stop_codon:yes gene_type:complete